MRIKINAKPKRLLMFKQYLFKLIDKDKCKGNGLILEHMFNPENVFLFYDVLLDLTNMLGKYHKRR